MKPTSKTIPERLEANIKAEAAINGIAEKMPTIDWVQAQMEIDGYIYTLRVHKSKLQKPYVETYNI